MFDNEKLKADLERDEAFKAFVYDDANAHPIKPGTSVVGHPTVGIGRALDVTGITRDEALFLLQNDINKHSAELLAALPWVSSLNEVRCRAIVNMCFNMGLNHLLGFTNTLAALKDHRWFDASAGVRSSVWYKQVGARAERIAQAFETGSDNQAMV